MSHAHIIHYVLKLPPLPFALVKISHKSLIVMGSSVNNGIGRIIIWKVFIASVPAEREFQNLHPGISGFFQQFLHIRVKDAQVLRNDLGIPDHAVNGIRQLFPRPFQPFSRFSILCPSGNGIIFHHSDEMIDSHHIIQPRGGLHAGFPPCKFLLFDEFPVVKRISPQLSVIGKCIRRHSSHF